MPYRMANVCRVCVEFAEDLLPMVAPKKKQDELDLLKPGVMFEDCLGIKVLELPDYVRICMDCKIQLTYYYDFKRKALDNHAKLMNLEKIVDIKSQGNGLATPDASTAIELSEDANKDAEIDPDHVQDEGVETEVEETPDYDIDVEYLEDDLNHLDLPGPYADDPQDGTIRFAVEVTNLLEDDCEEDTEYHILTDPELFGDANYETGETDDSEFTEGKPPIRKSSSNPDIYQCEICGKKFRNKEIYSGHLNVHQGLPAYCCEICTKEFKFKVNYDYHMKNHNNARNFQCSFCTKSCLSKWDLKVHMRTHTDVRPFNCEICGKGFRVRSHMTDHMETHNEKNTYECPTCLQKYKTKASLKMHASTVHLKSTQYPCKFCKKVFYRNHHLKIHQNIHMRKKRELDPIC